MPQIKHNTASGYYIGSDPELFISRRSTGEAVGSERVIPVEGITVSAGKIVRDGIQVELHPKATHCREVLGEFVRELLRELDQRLEGTDFQIDLRGTVDVSEKEMKELSQMSRVLGCNESHNAHQPGRGIDVDPETYQIRSAGGHIHLDLTASGLTKEDYPKLVPFLDIFVGNTFVLLDRDLRAAERRVVYGRAGEYRLPAHGLEYRTLSNAWLRSPRLLSFAFGMTRFALSTFQTIKKSVGPDISPYDEWVRYYNPSQFDFFEPLRKAIDIKQVITAINTNNFDLAWKNWEVVKAWILEYVAAIDLFPLHANTIPGFEILVNESIDKMFPLEGTLDRWLGQDRTWLMTPPPQIRTGWGWENFAKDLAKNHKVALKEAA